MKAKILGLLTMGFLAAPLGAHASSVFLNGNNFLQRGTFTNSAGVAATTFVYSLGTSEWRRTFLHIATPQGGIWSRSAT